MLTKNPFTIRNWTLNLPPCSTVHQPPVTLHSPLQKYTASIFRAEVTQFGKVAGFLKRGKNWATGDRIGFGGLGVACWPLVPKFAGSNLAKAVGFLARLPSEGKERPLVPCRRFAACKRSLNLRGSRNLGKIAGHLSRPQFHLSLLGLLASLLRTYRHLAAKVGTSKGGGKQWQTTPKLLAQDAVCQSHTGHMTGLWFLPARPLRLNTNEWMNEL